MLQVQFRALLDHRRTREPSLRAISRLGGRRPYHRARQLKKRPPRRAAQVREETPKEGCNIVTQRSMLRRTSYAALHNRQERVRMAGMQLGAKPAIMAFGGRVMPRPPGLRRPSA